MLERWRRRREDRRLRRLQLTAADWEAAIVDWSVAARYRGEARARLRELSFRLLLRKEFVGIHGLVVGDAMRLRIATMAAVPVLELGLGWYDDWVSVLVYPDAFVPGHDREDEFGVVHTEREPLTGETSAQGPVLLSWADVLDANGADAYNVVIHEMAHKLDLCGGGGTNGAPPLHPGMDPAAWIAAFTAAWEDLDAREAAGHECPIDSYALQDAGEFFAVVSECFFEAPQRLAACWPDVYHQLRVFYRQDPRAIQLGTPWRVESWS